MKGKSPSVLQKEKSSPCSDLESGLKPVIRLGKLLLAFPRLRLNLDGEWNGWGAWLFRLFITLFIAFSILLHLLVNGKRFLQLPLKDRLDDIFSFTMNIFYCLMNASFFYVSAYRIFNLQRLIRSHRDFEGKLAALGLHPRPTLASSFITAATICLVAFVP